VSDSAASPFRFAPLAAEHAASLAELFAALASSGDEAQFHPHPLTPAEAAARAAYRGKDLYFVALDASRVLGYGMLRGWDEGYDVPSLGIALHPDARGRGLGRAFMRFLHEAARARGARRVRLKVHTDNAVAVGLYRSLGYDFVGEERGQLVGYVDV
jgi:ribosomal protein S18 acetylase RimI-like enzyme